MLKTEDKIKFSELLQLLAKRFNNNRDLTSLDLKSYWLGLNDEFEDIIQFENICIKILKTWSYGRMPEPSYFIEAKKEKKEDLEIQALNEWNRIIDTIRLVGSYHSVKFENIVTNEAIRATFYDWYQLATKSYKDLDFYKTKFINNYISLYNNPQELKDEPLLGYCDNQNGFIDYRAIKTIKMLPNTNIPKIEKSSTQAKIEHNTSELNTKLNELKEKIKI